MIFNWLTTKNTLTVRYTLKDICSKKYLRVGREKRKLSLLNLANEVGISHSHLYYIESKKVVPSIDLVVKITKALDFPLKNLLD